VKPQEGTERVSHKKAQKAQNNFHEIGYYFVTFVRFCG
jgi:hypothetical protein